MKEDRVATVSTKDNVFQLRVDQKAQRQEYEEG